jgi:poly(3-hydroxybutyrate) depolymerase
VSGRGAEHAETVRAIGGKRRQLRNGADRLVVRRITNRGHEWLRIKPGQIVPQSGVYRIGGDATPVGMPHDGR